MMTFSFPANYKRYVSAELAIILARIGRDVNCRADDDPRVRRLADVPDALYTEPGPEPSTVTIMLVETQPLVAVLSDELPGQATPPDTDSRTERVA